MSKKTKTFDCVEMKHKSAVLVQKAIEGTSTEEELKLWQKVTEQLRKRKELLIKNRINFDKV